MPFLGNAAVWHCKTQTVLATRPGVRSLTVLPAATSYKTPLVIITKGLSPFIVRPEAACSVSELMLIVWIAVGVFHKAHSCSSPNGLLKIASMISSHMLHGVAVCAFRDFRIHSALRKITEKKLRTHQALGLMENLQSRRISCVDDIFLKNIDFLPNFAHNRIRRKSRRQIPWLTI